MSELRYTFHRTQVPPALTANWNASCWEKADVVNIDYLCLAKVTAPEQLPKIQAKFLYDEHFIYGIYQVTNEFELICDNRQYHGRIWEDSCVEFFIMPENSAGYFNLEMNVGGYHLMSYNVPQYDSDKPDARITTKIPAEEGGRVKIKARKLNDHDWILQFALPINIFTPYLDATAEIRTGAIWHGSFYKCVENGPHPHWFSWQPLQIVKFHQPKTFGEFVFE